VFCEKRTIQLLLLAPLDLGLDDQALHGAVVEVDVAHYRLALHRI
jgi:hypothetical protein